MEITWSGENTFQFFDRLNLNWFSFVKKDQIFLSVGCFLCIKKCRDSLGPKFLLSSPFFNKPETINREGRNYGPASLQMTLTNEIHFRTLDLMSNQSNHISLIFITFFSHLDSSQLQPSKKQTFLRKNYISVFGIVFFWQEWSRKRV